MPSTASLPSTTPPAPLTPRSFSCRCGRPIFFRNSECLACHTPLGYQAELRALLPLEADPAEGLWRRADSPPGSPRYRRCVNLDSASRCNWLVDEHDVGAGQPAQCRCCRLDRTLPDLSVQENAVWWHRLELAKRRLVSSLIGLGLPVRSKTVEDPARGMAFDFLRSLPGMPRVITGHADGVITVDVEEADDALRERRRADLHEPYRTLLGHLRHESGHYYWQRLVDGSDWLPGYREVFGDERQDYGAALKHHYENGPPADWSVRWVSAYASSHPWEDWAETWAHYLHLRDTLDTALSFGLEAGKVELEYESLPIDLGVADLPEPAKSQAELGQAEFDALLTQWMKLTGVLNELSRSMGVADFYPFVLSAESARKLYFVHRVIGGSTDAHGENPVR